ncbi:MAG: DUF4236 domain-containing protein [Hyphomicrobiales bacterium]
MKSWTASAPISATFGKTFWGPPELETWAPMRTLTSRRRMAGNPSIPVRGPSSACPVPGAVAECGPQEERTMSWSFRRSIRLPGGLRLNLNKKSWSVSARSGPGTQTISSTGRRTTSIRLPGGFRWRKSSRR